MSEAEAIAGEATEVRSEADAGEELALAAPVNPPSAIVPLEAEQVVRGMTAYQELLPKLLVDSDYQAADGKRFVKKSGWRKIARAFGLSVEIRSQHVERDGDGVPVRANVVARAVHAPTGQFSDGDGGCSTAESRFAKAKGRQKLENDLLATATTRAKNRAISDLVGMGDVSAEEVIASAGSANEPPPWGPVASESARQVCENALSYLHGGDRQGVEETIAEVVRVHGGYLPTAVVSGISTAAAIVKARTEPPAEVAGEEHGDA